MKMILVGFVICFAVLGAYIGWTEYNVIWPAIVAGVIAYPPIGVLTAKAFKIIDKLLTARSTFYTNGEITTVIVIWPLILTAMVISLTGLGIGRIFGPFFKRAGQYIGPSFKSVCDYVRR